MVSPLMQKIIVGAITLMLVGYFAYSLWTKTPDTTSTVDLSDTEIVSQDILSLVDSLGKVSIDKSVFSSVLFTSLVDYNFVVIPEAKGRPNPFAPIGQDYGSGILVSNSVTKKI